MKIKSFIHDIIHFKRYLNYLIYIKSFFDKIEMYFYYFEIAMMVPRINGEIF